MSFTAYLIIGLVVTAWMGFTIQNAITELEDSRILRGEDPLREANGLVWVVMILIWPFTVLLTLRDLLMAGKTK